MTLQHYLTRMIWVCILPLLLLSALFAIERVRDQRVEEERAAAQLLDAARSMLDDNLRARLSGLQTLAASPLLDDPARWVAFHLEASGFLAAFGSHVALIDSQRQTRLHTMVPVGAAPPAAPTPAGRSAVRLALERGVPAVGDLFDGTVAGEPMVGLAAPVRRDDEVNFVVGTIVPLRQLDGLLGNLPVAAGWSVALFDGQGKLLARRGAVSDPADADDDMRVTGTLNVAPWSVEVRALHQLTTRGRQRSAALLAAIVLGGLLAAWIGGRLASRRLARSVRSLSDPPGSPQPPAEIIEVRQARSLIDDAFEQRERSAAELRLREAQLLSILESASDAIIVTDASLSILMANTAALRCFGTPRHAMVGTTLEQLFPQRLRQAQRLAVEAAVAVDPAARGAPGPLELIGLRADGSEFPIEAALSAVPREDSPLITAILRDVTEARRLQAELRASQAELRSLMAEHHRVEDRERRRIARELHDELQQVMAAIKMDVAAIESELAADPKRLAPLVARLDRLAGTAVLSTRRIVNDLRPLILEELGLLPALEALCQQFQERTGIAARVATPQHDAHWPAVSEQIEICLYRVAQESLTNVAKHSGATQVELQLTARADGLLTMQIRDNGRGLQREGRRCPLAFGLKGMTERVRALGGSLNIESGPGGGAVVVVEVGQRQVGTAA